MARGARNSSSSSNAAEAPASSALPSAAGASTAALDADLTAVGAWTAEELAREIQAQREHLAELADFLQVLQDDNHIKDPAFATHVLDSLRRMEARLARWEAEFAKLLA